MYNDHYAVSAGLSCGVADYSNGPVVPDRVGSVHYANVVWMSSDETADPVKETFERLSALWKQQTGHFSIIQQKVLHPAYQEIIGMGEAVVPYLLAELKRQPGHWFWALRAIGKDNPAKPGMSVQEAIVAWTQWWAVKRKTRYGSQDF